MIDSHQPRFAQGVQSVLLALAFLLDLRIVVPLLALVLGAAALGGPRFNLFAYLYRALPIPRGEPEPAAPPRFAQTLGTIFLMTGTVFLFTAEAKSTLWWALGWGPALLVTVLAGLAATTGICVGCEAYLWMGRVKASRA
ncbi:MAG: hypothetical protein QOG54_1749 [Actinomycetota bacterium]|jgi:hypothetical protein|nr:hypothetical protein [Actinomycetota bacterium]